MFSEQVSVIITTKNEENNILNCMESIKNQSYPKEKIDIIIVDNSSIDRTVKIARGYTDRIYTFGPERSAQRNFGIGQSKSKFVLYLDADMSLAKQVISECVDKCEREGYIALYIPERIIGEGFWGKVRDFERQFYNSTVIDCVRFVRRDKFLEIGGFDEELTGPEDWDFDRRIKKTGKTGIINSPIYHNEGKFNLKRYIKKKIYYSHSFDRYIKKWGAKDPVIKKQLGFFYRYFEVFLSCGKWKRLIRHPLLAMGIYSLRIMVGAGYLKEILCKREKKAS